MPTKAERNAARKAKREADKAAKLAAQANAGGETETPTDTPTTETETAKPEAPAKSAKAKPFRHDIAGSYAGDSPTFNRAKSRTPLRLDIGAGSYTYRDDCFCRDLASKYSGNAFARGNADAGNIRRAHAHGFLSQLDTGELQLTAEALLYIEAAKPLQPGDKLRDTDLRDTIKRASQHLAD